MKKGEYLPDVQVCPHKSLSHLGCPLGPIYAIGQGGHPEGCPLCATYIIQSYWSIPSFWSHIGLGGHP